MAITDSLDAATQAVLALIAKINLSTARTIVVQDAGTADAYVFAPAPAVASYGPDLLIVADIANANTKPAPQMNLSGLGWLTITTAEGNPLPVGGLNGKVLLGLSSAPAGGYTARLLSVNAALLAALIAGAVATTARAKLAANTTFYVATTGSDQNSGLTAQTPFATLQQAWSAAQALDLNGFQVTIQVADGTYNAGVLATGAVAGGNGNNPARAPVVFAGSTNAVLNATNASCFVATDGARFAVQGFTLNASGTFGGQGSGLFAANGGQIRFSGTQFGNCAFAGIRAGSDGVVDCDGNYSINGSGLAHLFSYAGGSIYFNATNIIVAANGNCSYSVGFAWAQAGTIYVTSVTFAGSLVSGSRFNLAANGTINTNGGGPNYLSGNAAGVNDGTSAYI